MSRRFTIPEAVDFVERRGLHALEQRGFYSHFLRVRTRTYQALGTLDIRRRSVSRRSLMRIMSP